MKKTYRLIEIQDNLINSGEPYWEIQKRNIFGYWTSYFEEHSQQGATFYNKEEADTWYNYHIDESSRIKIKIIAQKTI